MTPGTGRWLAPIGASAAVLAVFVIPGVVAGVGGTATGPGPDRVPDGVVTPHDPVTPSLPPDGANEEGRRTRKVDVVGYRAEGRTLRIFYTVGQSTDCPSRIKTPRVQEKAGSVVVRLDRRPSRAPDEGCAHLLLTDSVDVRLDRPLGDRVVQDASRGGSLVPVDRPYGSDSVLPTPPTSRAGR